MENTGLLNYETGLCLKKMTEDFPYFQVAWILYLKYLKETRSSDYEMMLKKVAVRVSDRKKLYRFLNTDNNKFPINREVEFIETLQQKSNQDFDLKSNTGNSLIDKFLASNSGIIHRKVEEVNPVDSQFNEKILKNSVQETDEIITETLAEIYLKQKKYEKALEAFQKLSLKYPEKSVYFAARIEETEKLKNI